ncbi:MAG: OsmC family protein [bacterium]
MMEEKAQPHAMVKWVEGLQFVGRDDRGHAFVVDTAPDVGGLNQGVTPGKLLLLALAGCTGMDVISILRKKQQKVSSFEVAVWGEQAPDYPRKFVKIKVEYRVKGKDIDPEAVERAIQLSEEKYCLVRATLMPQVEITSSYTIESE